MCWSFVFFFFKQKTAYEMRISDWSSDVCSSDLATEAGDGEDQRFDVRRQAGEIDRNGFVVAVTFAGKVVTAVTDRAIAADELLEPDSFDEIAGAIESETCGVEVDAVVPATALRKEAFGFHHVPAHAELDLQRPASDPMLKSEDLR